MSLNADTSDPAPTTNVAQATTFPSAEVPSRPLAVPQVVRLGDPPRGDIDGKCQVHKAADSGGRVSIGISLQRAGHPR
jgi:hypothetical protein